MIWRSWVGIRSTAARKPVREGWLVNRKKYLIQIFKTSVSDDTGYGELFFHIELYLAKNKINRKNLERTVYLSDK